MINRSYFMVFRKTADDGNWAENSMTVTSKSWFPSPGRVFDEAKKHAEKNLEDKPGDSVFCTYFSRL